MWYYYVIFGVVLLAVIIMLIAKAVRKNKLEIKIKNLEIKGKNRYTAEENAVNSDGSQNLTYKKEDIILSVGKVYEVHPKNGIMPGKYILLSTNDKENAFNLRLGTYVREYTHGAEIVLAEGDTICAVNMPIILR